MIKNSLYFGAFDYVFANASASCRAEVAAIMPDNTLAYDMIPSLGDNAWTFELEKPIAAMGVIPERKGDPSVWLTWMIHTDEFPRIFRPLTSFVKSSLIPALENMGAHRCHAHSLATNVQAHRWFKLMGAVEESTMLRYGRRGEDFKVFRWDRR